MQNSVNHVIFVGKGNKNVSVQIQGVKETNRKLVFWICSDTGTSQPGVELVGDATCVNCVANSNPLSPVQGCHHPDHDKWGYAPKKIEDTSLVCPSWVDGRNIDYITWKMGKMSEILGNN